METIGIFEAKTHFSEICEKVFKKKEPILITKRGIPIVKINPITISEKGHSDIWNSRENYIRKHGNINEELEIPERTINNYKNPLNK